MTDLPQIDKARARRSFDKAAADYDSVAVLQREIADRMLERLELIKLQPKTILDLGAGTGYASEALLKRYPKARVIALDFAYGMVKKAHKRGRWLRRPIGLCADAEHLPLADGSIDLIFSNATLQWCNDLRATFADCLRVLSPEGLFMFSTFGPDTLMELRNSWARADSHGHVSSFMDMHDVGDDLLGARFADPVMDVEHITLTYDKVRELMRDLKTLGAHNATESRTRGLTGKSRLRTMTQAYEEYRRDGRLPATYEVVYGHAWAPVQRPVNDGVAIPLDSLRRSRANIQNL